MTPPCPCVRLSAWHEELYMIIIAPLVILGGVVVALVVGVLAVLEEIRHPRPTLPRPRGGKVVGKARLPRCACTPRDDEA